MDVTDVADGELAARRAEEKLRKQEEKARKAEEKAARQAERQAAQLAKEQGVAAPELTLNTFEDHTWGNLFIQSERATGREWAPLATLLPECKGASVWIRARVSASRKQGKALCFLALRQSMHTVQAVVYAKEGDLVAFAAAIPRESVVDVLGEITVPDVPIASCTQQHVEIQVGIDFHILAQAPYMVMPF